MLFVSGILMKFVRMHSGDVLILLDCGVCGDVGIMTVQESQGQIWKDFECQAETFQFYFVSWKS